jgi:phosphoglycerol transferase MdoB-like AlkP superfamily enzyme
MVSPRLSLYAAFILFFLSFAFLCKNRLHIWFLIGVNAMVSVFLLIDLWYVRAFNTLPTVHLLQQLGNLNQLSGSILLLVRRIDLLFVADVIVATLLAFRYQRVYRTHRVKQLQFFLTMLTSLLVLLYIPIGSRYFGKKDELALFKLYDPLISCYNLSPIGYHVLDVCSFVKDGLPMHLSAQRRREIGEWFAQKEEQLPDNRYKAAARQKNLIVIQVESLENFVLNRSIAGQEITPALNQMLAGGLYFPNLFEQINEGATSDAEFMTNTSVYPLRKGSTFFSYPDNVYQSLPNLLRRHGYVSLALHGDKGSYWNWAQALKAIGFDRTIDCTSLDNDETIGMGISDGSFFSQAAPILSATHSPFYAFLVTMSSHAPYKLPQKYRELRLEKAFDQTTVGGYLQSIHYTDKQIGQFLAQLKQRGILSRSIVVVYGDHEGIHKYVKDQTSKYPELANGKRVPLIISGTGLQPKKIAAVGGQIDILPSLAYLLGVDEQAYRRSAMGRNLLKTHKSFAVLTDGTYIGKAVSDVDVRMCKSGLRIADDIIRSDYFREPHSPY